MFEMFYAIAGGFTLVFGAISAIILWLDWVVSGAPPEWVFFGAISAIILWLDWLERKGF